MNPAAESSSPPAICPICQRKCPDDSDAAKFRPFCSQRCQQVDLMRWVDGRYAIVDELDDEQDAADEQASL